MVLRPRARDGIELALWKLEKYSSALKALHSGLGCYRSLRLHPNLKLSRVWERRSKDSFWTLWYNRFPLSPNTVSIS